MPYLSIFGLKFQKGIVMSEISTLELVKNESLTHTMNFGIGSAFSKGLGSAFSEGPGPGPLYNVCPKYARILNVSVTLHSIRSLYKLLSSYRNRDVFRTLSNIM